jgi:hypothetical protein
MLWRADKAIERDLEMSRWLFLVCAFVFFGFFGFADEARKNYRMAAVFICEKVFRFTPSWASGFSGSGSSNGGTLPRFANPPPASRIKKVIGDGLEFDETAFDAEQEKSFGRPRIDTTTSTTSSDTASLSEKDKETSLSNPFSPVAVTLPHPSPSTRPAYEDVDLPDLNGMLVTEPVEAHVRGSSPV